MTKSFPYLALDSAGRRTILCDHPVPMFGSKTTTKKETTKMNKTLSTDQLSRYVGMRIRNPDAADRYWARCMAQDGAPIDEEGIGKVKEFLKSRLSAEDHEQVCSMMDGEGDPPGDPDAPKGRLVDDDDPRLPGTPRPGMDRQRKQAADSFSAQFPDSAKIAIDNFGIQPGKRAASSWKQLTDYSADGAASFAAMFPGLAHIKQA
jgi:hypothetical protein